MKIFYKFEEQSTVPFDLVECDELIDQNSDSFDDDNVFGDLIIV